MLKGHGCKNLIDFVKCDIFKICLHLFKRFMWALYQTDTSKQLRPLWMRSICHCARSGGVTLPLQLCRERRGDTMETMHFLFEQMLAAVYSMKLTSQQHFFEACTVTLLFFSMVTSFFSTKTVFPFDKLYNASPAPPQKCISIFFLKKRTAVFILPDILSFIKKKNSPSDCLSQRNSHPLLH